MKAPLIIVGNDRQPWPARHRADHRIEIASPFRANGVVIWRGTTKDNKGPVIEAMIGVAKNKHSKTCELLAINTEGDDGSAVRSRAEFRPAVGPNFCLLPVGRQIEAARKVGCGVAEAEIDPIRENRFCAGSLGCVEELEIWPADELEPKSLERSHEPLPNHNLQSAVINSL
jgi:hypothetical protein